MEIYFCMNVNNGSILLDIFDTIPCISQINDIRCNVKAMHTRYLNIHEPAWSPSVDSTPTISSKDTHVTHAISVTDLLMLSLAISFAFIDRVHIALPP